MNPLLFTRKNFLLLSLLIFTQLAKGKEEEPANKAISYYKDIRPILQANCQGCHQPSKAKGKYIMTEFDKLIAGGDSGDPAIVPNNLEKSFVVEMITPEDGEAEMPQKADPLHETEIELIKKWILEGAKDDTPEGAKQRYTAENLPGKTIISLLKLLKK